MTSRLRSIAVGLLSWTLVLAVAHGQTGTPPTPSPVQVVEGFVFDRTGAPVPGVTMTLERTNSTPRVEITNIWGRFRFEDVAYGAYTLRAELTGFTRVVRTLTVAAAGPVLVTFTLEVGGLEETLTVSGAAPIVDTRRTSTGATFNRAVMDNVPTARDPWQIVNLTAGLEAGDANVGGNLSGQRWTVEGATIGRNEDYAFVPPNPFRLTTDEALSTFAADVDTASYTNTRRFLSDGHLPPPDAVRVEEFVNYFHYEYPDPSGEHPVSVTTEVGAAPWAPDHRLVLVGVKAQPIDQRRVSDRNIVLLIDVSGSMSSPNKLGLAKTALRMFVDTLRDDDRLAIVVYAGASGLVLPSTSGLQRARMHDAIENLRAGGSTNGAQGLQLAYQIARQEFVDGGINRVLLVTDGDFNVGLTSQSELLHLIEEKKQTGIFLSVLGVGTGNLKDSTMEMLADKGNGHYAYLDTLHEARRVLVEEGGATLETVAKDVKFQVEFNPATVQAWRLIGYENRLLAHQDFNDDTKDGGELGAGHTVTVLYEVVPTGVPLPGALTTGDGRPPVDDLTYQTPRRPTGNRAELLTVKIRYKAPDGDVSRLMTQSVRDGGAARVLPLASAVAEFALLLRERGTEVARFESLRDRLQALPVRADEAADREGLLDLVELATSLRKIR